MDLSKLTPEHLLEIPEAEFLRALHEYDQEIAFRELAEKRALSLSTFAQAAWWIVEPKTQLMWNWHHDRLCNRLERVTKGDISRLVVNLPPKSGKSRLVSVFWTPWEWLTNPWLRVQCLAKAPGVVNRDSDAMRRIVQSDWYRALANAVAINEGREPWKLGPRITQRLIENDNTGARMSISINTTVIGEDAHRQIIDDPHDTSDVLGTPRQVQDHLDKTNDAINKTLASRIQCQDGESFVLVMQRMHQNDASAEWKKLFPAETEILCLPMHFNPEHPDACPDDQRTERGQLLHPERHDEARVARMVKALGDLASAQLEQLPTPDAGGTYRKADWREYDPHPRQLNVDEIWMSVDPNVKETKRGSYFCAHVWGRRWRRTNNRAQTVGFDRFILDRIIGRWEHDDAREATRRLRLSWPRCAGIAIEDKANGPALYSDLRQEFSGVVMTPRRSDISKEVFNQVQGVPPCRAGEVFVPKPEHCPWVHDFRTNVERFPAEPNDDADTMSIMFVEWDGDKMKILNNGIDAVMEAQAQYDALLGMAGMG